ncbi:hypothetical protein PFISCL1PPCAC_26798, partial [Pristionchus fissidentatus]
LDMIVTIKESMKHIINAEKWMDDETRKHAQLKLHEMLYYAGNRDWIENDHLLDEYHKELNISREDSFSKMYEQMYNWTNEIEFLQLLRK